jgi:hypothetical protein
MTCLPRGSSPVRRPVIASVAQLPQRSVEAGGGHELVGLRLHARQQPAVKLHDLALKKSKRRVLLREHVVDRSLHRSRRVVVRDEQLKNIADQWGSGPANEALKVDVAALDPQVVLAQHIEQRAQYLGANAGVVVPVPFVDLGPAIIMSAKRSPEPATEAFGHFKLQHAGREGSPVTDREDRHDALATLAATTASIATARASATEFAGG